jgi:hypothetical protein
MKMFWIVIGLILIIGSGFALTQKEINDLNADTVKNLVFFPVNKSESNFSFTNDKNNIIVNFSVNSIQKIIDKEKPLLADATYESVSVRKTFYLTPADINFCSSNEKKVCNNYLLRRINFMIDRTLELEKKKVLSYKVVEEKPFDWWAYVVSYLGSVFR